MHRLSTSSVPFSAGPKLFQRIANPTAPDSTPSAINAPNITAETESSPNACTDCTMPDRDINVPKITSANVMQAHITAQRLNAPRWRQTVML